MGIDTKGYVGSLSIFHLTTMKPSQPHHCPPWICKTQETTNSSLLTSLAPPPSASSTALVPPQPDCTDPITTLTVKSHRPSPNTRVKKIQKATSFECECNSSESVTESRGPCRVRV
ncbi:hypothetical protein C1H46_028504 [Malus baccata]|uniref:Uncharacterized protein n=1 Tax=Malus baccata TaxID=106549 RepID=A0A540LHL1_MALBA|nr:hypothetical protein C1H46_028504 [Malus baccata]